MNIKVNDQNQSVTIMPEKLHTQRELDSIQKQDEILLSHKLPFDFFPDSITIEEGRLTVITRNFFFNSRVHSIDIKDVSNIFINMAPLFAQLVIVSKTFIQNEIKIKCLRKKEAIFARRVIEGLRIFADKEIDTSNYTKEELINKLGELSTTKIVT